MRNQVDSPPLPSLLVSPLCLYEELAIYCPSLAAQQKEGTIFLLGSIYQSKGKTVIGSIIVAVGDRDILSG